VGTSTLCFKQIRVGRDLKTFLDCVKLPNGIHRGSVPSVWVPKDATVESKPWHIDMKPSQPFALFISVPTYNFLTITHWPLQYCLWLTVDQHSYQPCAKSPAREVNKNLFSHLWCDLGDLDDLKTRTQNQPELKKWLQNIEGTFT
jgi:hypothetical protein